MKKLYYLIILTVILGLVLTGCFLSNVGQVPTTGQSGVAYLTKALPPPPTGLVGLWHFDEGLGTTASDSSVNSNDGTLHNFDSPHGWVSGMFGQALSFDGVDDYVSVGDIGVTGDWTVEFWANLASTGKVIYYPIGLSPASPYGPGIFLAYTNDKWGVYDGNADSVAVSGSPVSINIWYHFAVTKSDTTYTLYLNGVLESSGSLGDIDVDDLNIGRRSDVHWYFDGVIDEVAVYNRALTVEEVLNRYQSLLIHQSNTMVTIEPDVEETLPGGNVILTITEENTGNCDLTSPYVYLQQLALILNKDSILYYVSGDTGDDGVLGVGETWTWSVQTTIFTTTTFTATGHGFDPLSNDITFDTGYEDEQDFVEVLVTGATRTLGFWKTHLEFTTYIFENCLVETPSIDLGWKQVDSMSDMMGIFWANVAKDSYGNKRDALCKARVKASWQAMAAILNSSMLGGAPLPSGVDLGSIEDTLGGSDVGDIKALASQLDDYNMSGDDVALDPDLPSTGKADPNGAREIAVISFSNCL